MRFVIYRFEIQCTADEIDRVRRLRDDVLGIGGLRSRRYVETATA